jgi:hypothetical protein
MHQSDVDLNMLTHLYEAGDTRTTPVGIGDMITHHGTDDEARAWLVHAQEQGWIRKDQGLYPHYTLTPRGIGLVEAAITRRGDGGFRRRELRDRLLRWIDSQCPRVGQGDTRPSLFLERSGKASLDGVPFTSDDVVEATDYLVRNGLVASGATAWGAGHVRVSITHEGRECVDSGNGVGAYIERQRQTGTHVDVKADGGTVAFSTGVNSPAQAMSSTVNMMAVAALVEALEQAWPVLQLGEGAEEQLEALRGTDPSRISRALIWFGESLRDTSTGALGGALSGLVLNAMGLGG